MPRVSTARIVAETAVSYEGDLTLRELIIAHLRALVADPAAVSTVSVRYTNHRQRKEYGEAMRLIEAAREPGVPREPGLVLNLSDLAGIRIRGIDDEPAAPPQTVKPTGVAAIQEALAGDDPDLKAVAGALAVTLVEDCSDLNAVEVEEPEFKEVVEPPVEDRNAPLVGTSELDWLDRLGFPDEPVSEMVQEEQGPVE